MTLTSAAACTSGTSRDAASFCAGYDALADDNPFATLDVASPGEMRTAFGDLHEAALVIENAAPGDLRRPAGDYRSAVDHLVDLLDRAEFDPRNLDTTAYRRATIDYEDAATTLSNEARATCE